MGSVLVRLLAVSCVGAALCACNSSMPCAPVGALLVCRCSDGRNGVAECRSDGLAPCDCASDAGADAGDAARDASAPDLETPDGGTDAPPRDAGPGPGDASVAMIRPAPQVIPAGTTVTDPTWTITDALATPVSDACYASCLGTGEYRTALISVSEDSQITAWFHHAAGWSTSWHAGILGDCRTSAGSCLAAGMYEPEQIVTALVGPGTYELALCSDYAAGIPRFNVVIEPRPPAPTNTSCATAAHFGLGTASRYLQRRVSTTGPFYYALDWPEPPTAPRSTTLSLNPSGMDQGSMHLSVRLDCADASTEIAAADVPFVLGWDALDLAGAVFAHPTTTYYVVATAVTPGLEYDMGVDFTP